MTRATPGGSIDGSGGGGGGGPSDGGASLAVRELRIGEALRRARRPTGRRRRSRASTSRRSRRRRSARGRERSPLVVDPATGGEHGTAHDARGPDVAEDAALVAQPVHQARLAEQLVELRAVLRRAPATGCRRCGRRPRRCRSRRRRPTGGSSAGARRAARARSARRCRSRRAAGTRRGRGTADIAAPTSVRRARAARRASCLGHRRTRAAHARSASSLIAVMSRFELVRTRRPTPARRRASSPARRTRVTSVHAPRCASRSPTGIIADPVKRMCWKIICVWCSRQRVR